MDALPSIWCIPASEAPVVAVLVRLTGRLGWSCVLRWNWQSREVEQGAWARLRLIRGQCHLSASGEFLLYKAKGPLSGPFCATNGGGIAISRLPWLSALTDIQPGGYYGGGPSRHALSAEAQQTLWGMFKGTHLYANRWPGIFGPAWERSASARYGPKRVAWKTREPRARLAATAALPKSGLRLVVMEDRSGRASGDPGTAARFYLESTSPDDDRIRRLPGLRWAMPTRTGRILVATDTARLQALFPKLPGEPETPFRVEQDHDLNGLTPEPGPAPKWATAPLSAQGPRRDPLRSPRRRSRGPR